MQRPARALRLVLPGLFDQPDQRADQPGDALPRHRRDHRAVVVVVGGRIDTAPHDQPGPFQQVGLVVAQLPQQDLQLSLGGHVVPRGEVEQHQQHPRPLDVPEELMTQPLALARALDQPGNVGHHHLEPVVGADDAEIRLQRGEGVVGDLRLRRGDAADQRRLAHVGEADDGHVGQQLQLEPQPALLAVLTLLGERGSPPPVGQEPGVAPTPLPRLGRLPAVAVVAEVGQRRAGGVVEHHRSDRNLHLEIAPPGPVAVGPPAVGAVVGLAMGMITKRQQRGDVAIGDQPDRAAVTAVTAVGAAPGDVGLPAERHTARAAVTGLHVDVALVDERGHPGKARPPGPVRETLSFGIGATFGSGTATKLPIVSP